MSNNRLTKLQAQLERQEAEFIKLREKRRALEQQYNQALLDDFRKIGVLNLPYDILIGALLDAVEKHKSSSTEVGEWQKAASKFLYAKRPQGNKRAEKSTRQN